LGDKRTSQYAAIVAPAPAPPTRRTWIEVLCERAGPNAHHAPPHVPNPQEICTVRADGQTYNIVMITNKKGPGGFEGFGG
jgi:hypothetical protein